MAGKSGLNLTRAEPRPDFAAAYHRRRRLARADPRRLRPAPRSSIGPPASASTLFAGSSGRVFPRAMKASPLLRAWTRRLEAEGVAIRTRWRWQGWSAAPARFATPDGEARRSRRG